MLISGSLKQKFLKKILYMKKFGPDLLDGI